MPEDFTGRKLKFGTVIKKGRRRKVYGLDTWLVRCDLCGTLRLLTTTNLLRSSGACQFHEKPIHAA